MRPVSHFSVAALSLLLPACAVVTPSHQGDSAVPGDRPVSTPEAMHSDLGADRAVVAQPHGAAAHLNAEAAKYQAAGNYVAAAASLERAMRIEPGNPWLNLSMARLRLVEGEPRQAEMLARRALSRAARDRSLSRQCWELIAQARRAGGDEPGALEATRMADQQR